MSLRDHPEKFDTAFLAALFDRPAEALRGFDFVPVGTGQVGDSFRVTLDWREDEGLFETPPKTLVAKCPAADAVSRGTAHSMQLYEIETQFYAHFGAACGARVPHAYLADYDAASGDGLLLFEDMAPAKQIAQMDGCSLAQLEATLDEAARLHKSHWNDAKLSGHAFLTYSQQAERRAFVAALLPSVYPEWRARYAERLDADILDMGAALVARFDAYITPREGPVVLTHGDMRLDNMLFSDADGRTVLLDWQTASAGPPMGDIAYCISTSLKQAQERTAHEERLVAAYHAKLGACVGAYDLDAAWADYRRASFAGFIMAVISAMIVERTQRGDEMFAVMAERSGWQALHLDALSLI
ncbi:MAG: phosphotransferase [PS1 clade bacterium]|uniref:Phosphotransferase n=1 Tax=PS1 clade bacterium TaxID=2175152 RepID=A0A937HE74_9PROT|nr:phosphotransferase [PS1 clade bacterium]